MASRTLPGTIDTTAVMTALLYAELASGIQVHAVDLPPGWSLASAVLVEGDGGPANVSVPELTERFTLHSYGTTWQAARSVAMAVFNALHRWEGRAVTLTSGDVVYVPFVSREMGPLPNREPETEWPRWTAAYVAVMAEWAEP